LVEEALKNALIAEHVKKAKVVLVEALRKTNAHRRSRKEIQHCGCRSLKEK